MCPANTNSVRKNEIFAEIPSGVPRMRPYMIGIFVSLAIVYYGVVLAFRNSTSILGLPPPGDEFCDNSSSSTTTTAACSRSDLFAFQVASGLALCYCGVYGLYTWHITGRAHSAVPQTPEGRLFGYIPEAERLATVSFTFQLFDLLISLVIPEHCTTIMLSHHFMAACVSWCSVRYQYLHHYGLFYLGLSEASSIFLVFIDLARFFPPEPGTLFDQLNGIVFGPPFAILFTLYRVIMWWPVSARLFLDVHAVLKSGQASKLRPGKEWVLFVFLGMNIPLGLLQLYWFSIIVEEAKKVLL